jgi:hypothetical protein
LNEEKILCANLAVPGKDGSFHPAPDEGIKRSGNFEIDYIRIWTSEQQQASYFIDTYFEEKTDTIALSRLQSKTKFLYGNKSQHVNEGFTLSLIPCGNGTYNLQALGRAIPVNAHFSLSDGYFISDTALKYGKNLFSLKKGQTSLKLVVECYGRKLSYTILR